MQLRDHPLMTRKSGVKSWPPLWVSTTDINDRPRGELGILKRVTTHSAIDNGIFLWIDYEGFTYIGSMYLDDFAFHHMIRDLLDSMIGVSIKEIGDIDLSFTL
jgi:hypothetical protein